MSITITPSGVINLCKVPLEVDNENQLTFANSTKQLEYFNSKVVKNYSEYTYMKKDGTINVYENIDNIMSCNYLFYRNNGFTNKYYYCYIVSKEYVNENCTRLNIKTDVFQTWQFDIVYNQTFIEREHVENDTRGLHTYPESLETGDYVANGNVITYDTSTDSFGICVSVTELLFPINQYDGGRVYNGIYSGTYLLVIKTPNDCDTLIAMYDKKGKADAITSLYLFPLTGRVAAEKSTWTMSDVGSCDIWQLSPSSNADFIKELNVTVPTSLGKFDNNQIGYIPKNNKLLTYPYSYLLATNNSGIDVPFSYESFYFYDNDSNALDFLSTCTFRIYSSVGEGMNMKAVPYFYNGQVQNYNEGIMLGKLPVCSWNSDTYTNWLTQNGVNIGLSLITGGLDMYSGYTNLSARQWNSGLDKVVGTLANVYQHSLVPDQSKGNTNAGNINYSYHEDGGFSLIPKSIKPEYARVIDNYFTMYGYKVCEVKVPNLKSRKNFNYIKTINCNFDGDLPQQDLQEIKEMFNKGLTLWHNAANIYNYNVDNSII